MSEEQQGGFLSQIKNQILTTLGLIITAAGGLVVANMEAIFGVGEEPQAIEITKEEPQETKKDTLVIVQKQQPKVIVKKVKPKKTETEKRKEEFDW